jgi:hypothetical protein
MRHIGPCNPTHAHQCCHDIREASAEAQETYERLAGWARFTARLSLVSARNHRRAAKGLLNIMPLAQKMHSRKAGTAVMEEPETLRPIRCDQSVVLVVEDDVMVRDFARVVLEGEGYFILTADNGEEAMCISRRYRGDIHVLLSPSPIAVPFLRKPFGPDQLKRKN